MGPILIVLTTRSNALTSDTTGVVNAYLATQNSQMAFATPVASEVKALDLVVKTIKIGPLFHLKAALWGSLGFCAWLSFSRYC